MADPVTVLIPEWTWIKVATAVNSGIISKIDRFIEGSMIYYQTYRLTGSSAPSAPTPMTIPEEAVQMFIAENQAMISSTASIDVYVLCANKNPDLSESGLVRVDL